MGMVMANHPVAWVFGCSLFAFAVGAAVLFWDSRER